MERIGGGKLQLTSNSFEGYSNIMNLTALGSSGTNQLNFTLSSYSELKNKFATNYVQFWFNQIGSKSGN